VVSRAKGHSAHFDDKLVPAEAARGAVVVIVRAVHVLGRRRLVYFDVPTAKILFVFRFGKLEAVRVEQTNKSFARRTPIATETDLFKI
jgi:hypothetical protein